MISFRNILIEELEFQEKYKYKGARSIHGGTGIENVVFALAYAFFEKLFSPIPKFNYLEKFKEGYDQIQATYATLAKDENDWGWLKRIKGDYPITPESIILFKNVFYIFQIFNL